MSSKDEWARYQEAMRQGDVAAAAAAFRRWQAAKLAEGKGRSKPTLVSLSGRSQHYPKAIPVDQIPDEMERNPEFFEHMRKILGEG